MSTVSSSSAGRRVRELDGLRAFAILPVMFYHFAPSRGPLAWLGGLSSVGWTGVDLFFVLSGFLITGVLLDSKGKSHYYRDFIVRRALRILPLYYLCLIAFTAATYYHPDRSVWIQFQEWGGVGPYFGFAGNIVAAIQNEHPPVFSFIPLWSLQVEEQFYLLYPLLVATVSPTTLRRVLLAAVVAAPLLRLALVLAGPQTQIATYVLMPCRMDSLALGGLIAVQLRLGGLGFSSKTMWRTFVFFAGCCALLFVTVSTWERHHLVRSIGFSLIGLAYAALLAAVLHSPKSPAAWICRNRFLIYTGQISYGLYLLHGPVAWLTRTAISKFYPVAIGDSINLVISLAVSYAAAALSWHLFETRILRLKDRFTNAPPVGEPLSARKIAAAS
jgi:peptidoglycan/LPS O-acetylase OafA/YrhL